MICLERSFIITLDFDTLLQYATHCSDTLGKIRHTIYLVNAVRCRDSEIKILPSSFWKVRCKLRRTYLLDNAHAIPLVMKLHPRNEYLTNICLRLLPLFFPLCCSLIAALQHFNINCSLWRRRLACRPLINSGNKFIMRTCIDDVIGQQMMLLVGV